MSFNPTRNWALQASYGHLVSPEQLTPDVGTGRVTASASYNWRFDGSLAQTTFAWGQDRNRPGKNLDGYLLETAVHLERAHTVFARAERVDKDELFGSGPQADNAFTVGKLSLGYIYEFARWKHSEWGVGGVGSLGVLPSALKPVYGSAPASMMLFARVKLI